MVFLRPPLWRSQNAAAFEDPSAQPGVGSARLGQGAGVTVWWVLAAVLGLVILVLGLSLRVVKQFERGVLFRFGQVEAQPRKPGLTFIVPIIDRLQKVSAQIVPMPVPAQDAITRDNVTVRVDAVVYFRVIDPIRVAVDVEDYISAV